MKTIYARDYGSNSMSKEDMLKEMVGKTFTKVDGYGDELRFVMEDGTTYVFYHDQSCCESVGIEDIAGDLSDLENTPLLMADESTNDKNPPEVEVPKYQDSFLWTFYRFRTIKGSVDIRWYGDSNGYYSVEVDLRKEIPA
jgi:hypothetical protein